ncbi:MAG: antitoxin HicB [Sphingomonadales bacterium]|jgi:predicted RNase H-like HicB family nuclease|nr:antitoxin HicB [Sphingomonadales bacterium]
MFDYPVRLEPDDNDTILVTFPDVPGAITFGETEAEALDHAVDALETILNFYMQDRRDIPFPSPAEGRSTVAPTLLGSLKLILYLAMRARGWQGRPRPRPRHGPAPRRPPARPQAPVDRGAAGWGAEGLRGALRSRDTAGGGGLKGRGEDGAYDIW